MAVGTTEQHRFFDVDRRTDGTAAIVVRRPPVNAMSPELLVELERLVSEVGARAETRAVVFASAVPDYFMVGFDLAFVGDRIERGLVEADLDDLRAIAAQVHRTMNAIEAMPQPTIAAISGHAVGGGFELSLACDLRLMSDDPRFRIGLPEVLFGVIPAAGGTQRLPRIVGKACALSMLLEGRRVDPREALRIGLVHELAPPESFDQALATMLARVLKGGAFAQSLVKRCVREAFDHPEAGYRLEEDGFAECVRSTEGQERIRAFLEKGGRKPR